MPTVLNVEEINSILKESKKVGLDEIEIDNLLDKISKTKILKIKRRNKKNDEEENDLEWK